MASNVQSNGGNGSKIAERIVQVVLGALLAGWVTLVGWVLYSITANSVATAINQSIATETEKRINRLERDFERYRQTHGELEAEQFRRLNRMSERIGSGDR